MYHNLHAHFGTYIPHMRVGGPAFTDQSGNEEGLFMPDMNKGPAFVMNVNRICRDTMQVIASSAGPSGVRTPLASDPAMREAFSSVAHGGRSVDTSGGGGASTRQ